MAEENKDCMPRLRFPEFLRDDGKFVRLESVARYINDKIHIDNVNVDNYISTENMLQNYKGICQAANLPSVSSITVYQPNDILISNIRPYLKKIWLSDRKGGASNDIIVLRPHKVNPKYLYQYLTTDRFISYLMKGVKGTKMPRGDIGEIKKYLIYYVDGREQQKIADCLSSLDELIEAHEQKRDALVEHKKGLMQRIFPAEGETTPRWRFPEFRKANAWEQKSLGQVCKTFSGGTPSTSNKAYYGGDIPFIRSAEINKTKTELFLTELGLKNSSAKLVKEGDILLALYGANSGEVAISKMSGAINQAILCLRSTQNDFFIFHYLFFKKDYFISKYLQGGQGNFSAEIVKAIFIPLPSIPEQQKIADCLSSLDARIEAEEAKIASVREHKQGLMQRLFPQSL